MAIQAVRLNDSGDDYATVSGESVHRSDFAYVGDPKLKSSWKLPIHDEEHIRAALARFNQAELPSSEKSKVARRIVTAAKKKGIDTSGFEKKYLGMSDARAHFTTQLSSPLPIPKIFKGREVYEIPIAVTGSWVKGADHFSITSQDLDDMVRNFEKRLNEQVVIDYDHASENPDVARGHDIPAAGWIHSLRAENGVLKATVEFTQLSKQRIANGEYRFVSPAIDWTAMDKRSGEPQGTTLTSLALTNHPFLEELPELPNIRLRAATFPSAVLLTDLNQGDAMTDEEKKKKQQLDDQELAAGRKKAEELQDQDLMARKKKAEELQDQELMARKQKAEELQDQELAARRGKKADDTDADEDMDEGELEEQLKGTPRLKMRKMAKGRYAVMPKKGGKPVGYITGADLDELEELQEELSERVGCKGMKLTDIKTMIETDRTDRAANDARKLILSEAVTDKGEFDKQKAGILAGQNKIALRDYVAADKANDAVLKAIVDRKALPHQRKFLFSIALERPEEFAEFIKKAPALVPAGLAGHGSSEPVAAEQQIQQEVEQLRQQNPKLTAGQALSEAKRKHPELAREYDRAHLTDVKVQ